MSVPPQSASTHGAPGLKPILAERYLAVRRRTQALVAPLSPEDCVVQSMEDASPAKWHLAHTTWFFETFVLGLDGDYEPFHHSYNYLFNSYYDTVGERHARPHRGLLTRPSLSEVQDYRRHVDACMQRLLDRGPLAPELEARVVLGLNHEEQHQELLVTDVLHLLSCNPLQPAYEPDPRIAEPYPETAQTWRSYAGGLASIGHRTAAFAYDNEGPAHRVWLEPFELASRTVTTAEYLEFVEAGGYDEARWWLSDGWAWLSRSGVRAPMHWRNGGEGGWSTFTLHGRAALDPNAPVMHLSFYEADAYARFRGARLPRETEWEVAMRSEAGTGSPAELPGGEVWEWTMSPYVPYPGYAPASGALGEYNGKFMSGQMVLRGSSIATAPGHARVTYRNFFPPEARWQFSGLRLARDGS